MYSIGIVKGNLASERTAHPSLAGRRHRSKRTFGATEISEDTEHNRIPLCDLGVLCGKRQGLTFAIFS